MDLPTNYQEFIYKRTYSRWLENEGRRENWNESVNRYRDFFLPRVPEKLRDKYVDAIESFRRLEVMGAMRSLWTAGPALDVDNVAGFNCGYTPIACPKDFAELLYILMNGTGVGISVERQYINQLPEVPLLERQSYVTLTFEDSKMGWAEGFWWFLCYLYRGIIPKYDLSLIRPKGSRLKTFGGRASGPEPLKDLLEFTTSVFIDAENRKLTSEECADIACKVAECVVVGGIRRSAIIILTNPSDRRMANFKIGRFWERYPHRVFANISSCYTDKPDAFNFTNDWLDLIQSGCGERGIVNRESLKWFSRMRGREERNFGVNPCGEVILRPKQFCNLTEAVVRPGMNFKHMLPRVEHAILLGIVQSTMTNFKFINYEWRKNTEEEHLLGASLTGLMDNPLITTQADLETLRVHAEDKAREFADIMDIPCPAAVTCVKPSGTVSQLADSSSGIHPRFSRYYIRRVRVAATDPVAQFMIDQGIPWQPEIGETVDDMRTAVFEFPMKSPDRSVTTDNMTAIQQLEIWKRLKKFWTHHNASATIFVDDSEWMEVGGWVHKNWDFICGLTFLPKEGGHYLLAPYEEIDKQKYEDLAEYFPVLDWKKLDNYEETDQTSGQLEFACVGGQCEL